MNSSLAVGGTSTGRRDRERLAVSLDARLYYGSMVYTGRVSNISETGMFICTKVNFPVDVLLMASVQSGSTLFSLPIQVRRMVRPGASLCGDESGLGVRLINPPAEYLDFVRRAGESR